MADFNLKLSGDTETDLSMIKKTLTWLLANLDSANVTSITTNRTTVQSENGETIIQGPLLVMYDQQDPPIMRLLLGYDKSTSKFVFNMYDMTGAQTITLNDLGEAVFGGNLSTLKDALIGYNLTLGSVTDGLTSRKITFANREGFSSEIEWNSDVNTEVNGISDDDLADMNTTLTWTDGIKLFMDNIYASFVGACMFIGEGLKIKLLRNLVVDSEKVILKADAYINDDTIEDNRIAVLGDITGASGTFTTVDEKTVTVTNGLITSIV